MTLMELLKRIDPNTVVQIGRGGDWMGEALGCLNYVTTDLLDESNVTHIGTFTTGEDWKIVGIPALLILTDVTDPE